MSINRVIILLLDGVGAGAAPDADLYGDVGSNSLVNTARAVGGLNMPHLEALGLGHIDDILGVPPAPKPTGACGKMIPRSAGKDTISGHWELMGIYLPEAFPTYPNGFPQAVIDEFVRRTGVPGVLANRPASGTEIIKELGEEHMRTGKPIVYTSADSVFQIAANEAVIPLEELYRMSETARAMLTGKHNVGRVIARPFVGSSPADFKRTAHRRDYPRVPDSPTMLDKLVAAGKEVYAVGKIDDIFANRGITRSNHTVSNADSIQATLKFMEEDFQGVLFTNLIEYDMIYGHRNDARGYAGALEAFDQAIPEIKKRLRLNDLVFIVADHGVDPTTPSTDHSRECIPLVVFGMQVLGKDLGTRETFADVAATLAEIFNLEPPEMGTSFLSEVLV